MEAAVSDNPAHQTTVSLWATALRNGRGRRVPAEKARELATVLGVQPSDIRPDLWPAEVA